MTDQTPDPWKDVQPRHLCQSCGLDDEQYAWREGFNAAIALALEAKVADDRALAAERAQHQQEIAKRDETIRQLQDAFARCQEVQQATAETWRVEHDQMAEQIATLTQERDKAQQLNAAAYIRARRQANVCEPNMDQYAGAMAVIRAAFPNGHIDFSDWVHIGLVEQPSDLLQAVKRRAEAAEARCATLTAALEQIESRCRADAAKLRRREMWDVAQENEAIADELRAALSGVPTP